MEKSEMSRLFAYIGLIMIIAAIAIGIWIGIENRNLEKEDDLENYADAEKRITFFYNRNISPGFIDIDRLYPVNPVPGYTGFGFFLLMGGITFVLFAFYNATSQGEELTENIAKLGILVVIISLILSAWVGYTQYKITDEKYAEDPDMEDMQDMFESMIIVYYVNSALVFLGPALILFSIFRENVPTPEDSQKYLFYAGFIILIAAIVLALVSGIYTKKMAETWMDLMSDKGSPGDINDLADWFKLKAFMAQFYIYLSYLSLGLMVSPFVMNYTKEKFSDSKASTIAIIGLVCMVVGVALAAYPAIQYHKFADEFGNMFDDESGEGAEDFEKASEDYNKATAFCYFGTSVIFLGLGLMLFSVLFGHYLETGELSTPQTLNIIFVLPAIIGFSLGIYAGVLKHDFEEGDATGFLTVDYLFMILLFSSTGLMVFNWTQNAELFQAVRNLCPDCGEEVRFLSYYDAWYCEMCEETMDEPVREVLKPCPDCGDALDFISDYDSWYCEYCGDYKVMEKAVRKKKKKKKVKKKKPAKARGRAPAPGWARKTPRCRDCQGPMTYIPQYERWYCYTCQRYGGVPQTRTTGAGAATQRGRLEARQVTRRPATSTSTSTMFKCPGCGKVAEIKTDKRPLKLKCSKCGMMSMMRK